VVTAMGFTAAEKQRILAEARGHVRGDPPREPIRKALVEKSGNGAAVIYKRHEDALVEPAAEPQMTMSAEATEAWHRWWIQCLDHEWQHGTLAESIAGAVSKLIDQRTAPLEKKIRALERKLVRKSRR
jgi:hypothetical protein